MFRSHEVEMSSMGFLWIIAIVVVIWAFFLILKGEAETTRRDDPLKILEDRLASGEITEEEFERKKQILDL